MTFFKDFFFNVDHFLKSLLHLLHYYFCFMLWYFGHQAYRILAPQLGIEPTPPALEGEVLITGPPGKSLHMAFYCPIIAPFIPPLFLHGPSPLPSFHWSPRVCFVYLWVSWFFVLFTSLLYFFRFHIKMISHSLHLFVSDWLHVA